MDSARGGLAETISDFEGTRILLVSTTSDRGGTTQNSEEWKNRLSAQLATLIFLISQRDRRAGKAVHASPPVQQEGCAVVLTRT